MYDRTSLTIETSTNHLVIENPRGCALAAWKWLCWNLRGLASGSRPESWDFEVLQLLSATVHGEIIQTLLSFYIMETTNCFVQIIYSACDWKLVSVCMGLHIMTETGPKQPLFGTLTSGFGQASLATMGAMILIQNFVVFLFRRCLISPTGICN